jgi:hypothetical protein
MSTTRRLAAILAADVMGSVRDNASLPSCPKGRERGPVQLPRGPHVTRWETDTPAVTSAAAAAFKLAF